jgi:hypothetical protein
MSHSFTHVCLPAPLSARQVGHGEGGGMGGKHRSIKFARIDAPWKALVHPYW